MNAASSARVQKSDQSIVTPTGSILQPIKPHRGGARALFELERGWLITAVALVALTVLPILSGDSLPLMTEGLLLLVMCYGWNLVGGYLGEFSFAHMIFWGLGSYLAIEVANSGQSPWIWLIVLVMVAVVAGALLAGLIRASGLKGTLPIGIFTMVLGQIAITIVSGNKGLGADAGLIAMSLSPLDATQMYLLLAALVVVVALLNVAAANSRWGREWLAIRDDPTVARVVGVRVQSRRVLAYMLSAGVFALGGAYQAIYSGFAMPNVSLSLSPLILVTLAVFIGGPGTPMGPLAGWIVIYGLQVAAEQLSSSSQVSLIAQLIEFAVALLFLRIVTPRLGGLDMTTALLRRLKRRRAVRQGEQVERPKANAAIRVMRSVESVQDPADGDRAGLALVDVRKSFGRLHVLRGVDFVIRPGEIVGIVGPNGAGKSTLCNLISGIEELSGGRIDLDDRDISRASVVKRAGMGFGRSFQTPRLFASLSLAQNLAMGGRGLTDRDAEADLEAVGVADARRRSGQDPEFFTRRLTEVTKAALQGTSVLLLDEPLAGLTPPEQAIVLTMAREAARAGACVAIVEHLIPVIAPVVDRMVVLHEGRIIADGLPDDVLSMESVIDAYLGSAIVKDGE